MAPGGFDHEIVQQFLTESGELLEQLEGDLVALEAAPRDPELINRIFRALHTIKGGASFLELTQLVEIAHAGEAALNAARAGHIVIDETLLTLLLDAVDVITRQLAALARGEPLPEPDPGLIEQLTAAEEHSTGAPRGAQRASPMCRVVGVEGEPTITPLRLLDGREALLEYFITDLHVSLEEARGYVERLSDAGTRAGACAALAEAAIALARCVDFFGIVEMADLAEVLGAAADRAVSLDEPVVDQLVPRLLGIVDLLRDQADGLSDRVVRSWPAKALLDQIETLLGNIPLEQGVAPAGAAETGLGSNDDIGSTKPHVPANQPPADARSSMSPERAAFEPTIRVEAGRLDALLNLVGELVLQKNRIAELSRRLALRTGPRGEMIAAMRLSAGELDRVTSDIQAAVMRTRMQPLDRIFGRYPRLVRDLARKSGKKIELVVEGGGTEVDKSVIEQMGDPMIHLLRNAGDHGIEPPEERLRLGKPPCGTIRIRASHQGSCVQIRIDDDGRGLNRDAIVRTAIERGLVSAGEIAGLTDPEIYRFILTPGFSTVSRASDLSGRGVGMDVVRTNIERMNGSIELSSRPTEGTTVLIRIPLTIAIMPAMMVGVAGEIYAIPLTNIVQIVRLEPRDVSTILGIPVLRLRDAVLPLVDAAEVYDAPPEERRAFPFAVVLSLNERRVGLMVSELIGQQEIVVKPLEGLSGRTLGPISGAAVRSDGEVSLILDIEGLFKLAEETHMRIREPALPGCG